MPWFKVCLYERCYSEAFVEADDEIAAIVKADATVAGQPFNSNLHYIEPDTDAGMSVYELPEELGPHAEVCARLAKADLLDTDYVKGVCSVERVTEDEAGRNR